MNEKSSPYDNPALLTITRAVDSHMQRSLMDSLKSAVAELQAEIDQMEEVLSSCFQIGMPEGGQSAMLEAHQPLFDGWKRKLTEMQGCQAEMQRLHREGQPDKAESRVETVCQLLTYWVFDEINTARHNRQNQVVIPLEQRPERIGQLLVEVMKKAPPRLNLSCQLANNQVTISF